MFGNLPLSHIAFLECVALITSAISATVGMVGGVLMLGGMSFVLPYSAYVPLHGVVQLASNSTRAFYLRRNISWRLVGPFLLGMLPGIAGGYLLLKLIPDPEFFTIAIVALLLFSVFRPKALPGIAINPKGFFILGLVATSLGAVLGATGPLLAPFFMREDLAKEEIVSSQAFCQLLVHLAKLPIFFALDFPFASYAGLLLLLIAGTVVGTRVGVLFLKKLNQKQFFVLVRIAMAGVAVRMLYVFVMEQIG